MHTQAEIRPDRTGIADYYSANCGGNKSIAGPDIVAGGARDLSHRILKTTRGAGSGSNAR